MKVFYFDINHFPDIFTNNNVQNLCIGKFDGIHKGHETLITQEKSSILTFRPLPYVFFGVKENLVYTEAEKKKIFENLGVENVLCIQFDENLANCSGEEFLQKIGKITQKITVGKDFRFGKNRTHGVEEIIKFGIKLNAIEPITGNFGKISSSFLKNCIKNGNFIEYRDISNIPFHLTSTVLFGEKIASEILKTPTMNMVFPENKITPPFGVYATQTEINGMQYNSISNFGVKPTFCQNNMPILETHIFNFSQNVYNMEAKVSFLEKIREEKKFSNINELHFQIMQDMQECKKVHEIL